MTKCYVIKRDDGKYYKYYHYSYEYGTKVEFTEYLEDAKIFDDETTAYSCTRDIELEIGDCCEVVPVTIVEGDIQELQNQKAVEALKEALNYAIKHYNEEETDMKVAVAYRKCATKISELLEEYGGNE